MSIKAIAIDMDGTLLDDTKHISNFNQKMIASIQSSVHIIISSARGMGSLRPYIHQLGLHGSNQYTVAYNGGYIIDGNDTVLDHHPIDIHVALALIECIGQTTSSLEINVYTADKIYQIPNIDNVQDFLMNHPIYKIGAIGQKTEVDRVRGLIPVHFNQLLAITSDKVSIECVSSGLSKAKGLALVLEKLGLSHDELCAIGDAENDIQMLDMAGFGIAMGNGDDVLLSHADYITTDNNHDGVGKAIDYLIKHHMIMV